MSDVKRVMQRAMTAKQLIEQLEDMDPEAAVFFVCDYGDHCHTEQALPVKDVEEVTESALEESAYSNSGVAMRRDDDEDGVEDGPESAVIILR